MGGAAVHIRTGDKKTAASGGAAVKKHFMDDCAHAEEKQTVCLSPSFIRRPYREGKPKIINCHNSQDTPIWVDLGSIKGGSMAWHKA